MARKLTTREYVLVFVLVVVGAVVLYWNLQDQERGGGQALDEEKKDSALADAPVVMLALLTKPPEQYDPHGRDLFKYADRPLTAEELEARRRAEEERQRRLREEAERRRQMQGNRAKAQERQKQAKAPPRPTGPVPPRAAFAYLGYLGPKDDKIAVFERGQKVLLARAGEVVEEQFVVKEINYEVVVLGYTKEQFKNRTTELNMKRGR